MKKITFTSALLLLSVIGFSQQAPAQAPQAPTAEQMAQREANALSQRLSLTEDQRSKAYSIYLERAKKDIAAREARMKEMEKQREQAANDAKQQSDKISALLNADQKKTFQDMQSRMNNRPGGPGAGFGMRQGPQQFGRGFGAPRGGGQFQGPGNQGPRFQGAPGQQFRQRNMSPQFQGPQGQRNFRGRGPMPQQGGPGGGNFGQGLREQLRQRSQSPQFQDRLNQFRNRFNAPAPAPAPNNNQQAPSSTK